MSGAYCGLVQEWSIWLEDMLGRPFQKEWCILELLVGQGLEGSAGVNGGLEFHQGHRARVWQH